MTIEDIKSVVSEYADFMVANLKSAKEPGMIKEYANKLRLSEKIIKAIDSGELKINA